MSLTFYQLKTIHEIKSISLYNADTNGYLRQNLLLRPGMLFTGGMSLPRMDIMVEDCDGMHLWFTVIVMMSSVREICAYSAPPVASTMSVAMKIK